VGGAFAFLVAAVLLALAVGTGSARAAGGTYRVTAGGDSSWSPASGNIDQTSSDPLGATGTLVGTGGAVGNADYELQAGPGIVRTKLGGTFAVPSGLAYSFDPQTQAVSSTELTVSGPSGGITTSVSIHVDGVIGIPACGTSDPCGALDVEIHAGLGGIGSEFNTFGDARKNELGLALDPIPGGYRVHGDVSSSPFGMPTNTPVPITLTIALGGGLNGRSAPSTFGGTFNDPEALYQVSFAPSGPVLNNVPAGYTVSGQNVVDNHWTDPFAESGPPDSVPPTVVGVPDRQPNVFGWYRAPVTIDWQASDNSSQASDPADTVADQDGKDVHYTSNPSCDPSNNCATGTVNVSLDQIPPVVTCREAPVFEVTQNSLAFVSADESDTLSGSPDETPGVGVDISSAGQKTVDVTGEDFAGNTTTITCPYTVVATRSDTQPPVVTVPADSAIDATSPAGARASYSASATDDVDSSPTLVCTPPSGSVLPIGTTTVTCKATDDAGNSAGASFKIRVRGAGEQIASLTDKTLAYLDQPALKPVLKAALQAVADAIAAKHPKVACIALDLYVVAVKLAPAKAFTAAEKADLIADATRIKAVIGC
jgi:hypothetical protein